MNSSEYFRIICGILLVMQTISRIAMTNNRQPGKTNQVFFHDREQIFVRLAGLAVTLAYVYVVLPDSHFLDFFIPDGLRWAGAGLMLIGNLLFIAAHAALGKNWSPMLEIRSEHQLVDWGIYRWIRHPMYSGFLVFGVGMALLSANGLGCAYILVMAVMIFTRLPDEETMMAQKFGTAYASYRSRTSALIPFIY